MLFPQSGCCCDGSSRMCYPCGDFIIGENDVRLREIGDTPVCSEAQRRQGRTVVEL
ncbi:DUF779 domain-containing protein [Mesorhizobium sp. ESP-6-2]|uniref:DUF779 domain-containing protein n=1 Tax=unclassified Mesorhizobium TaxID=325217 RepID=UPI00398C7FCF